MTRLLGLPQHGGLRRNPRWFRLDILAHLAPKRTRYAWKEGDSYGAQENSFGVASLGSCFTEQSNSTGSQDLEPFLIEAYTDPNAETSAGEIGVSVAQADRPPQ